MGGLELWPGRKALNEKVACLLSLLEGKNELKLGFLNWLAQHVPAAQLLVCQIILHQIQLYFKFCLKELSILV